MQAHIEQLLILQDRDRRLAALKEQSAALPTERRRLEARKTGAAAEVDAARLALKENESARKTLELEAESRRAAIARYKQQQLETRKNEEFTALAHEIARAEEDIRGIEDRELAIMEQAEVLKQRVQTAEAMQRSALSEIAERAKGIDEKAAVLEKEIAEVQEDREGFARNVDEDTLVVYERLLSRKSDALAPLAHGVCGGCHMKVSSGTAASVRTSADLEFCDQCGRILYPEE